MENAKIVSRYNLRIINVVTVQGKCTLFLFNRTASCPTCRKHFVDVIKVYAQFQCEEIRDEREEIVDQLLKAIAKHENTIKDLNTQILTKNEKIKKFEMVQSERKKLLSAKETELKTLRTKLKENTNIISDLNNSVSALKAKSGNPSAKLNAKNIELTKQNDDLRKQMEDLKIKLTAKSSELDRCQKAAAQKNKIIKEFHKDKRICNVPEHKNYVEAMKMCKTCELKEVKRIYGPKPEIDNVMMHMFGMSDLFLALDSDIDSDSS